MPLQLSANLDGTLGADRSQHGGEMTLSDTLSAVARLARLALEPNERERFARDLEQILGAMDRIRRVDTTDTPAFVHALGEGNSWREDVVEPVLPLADVLRNAPDARVGLFAAPRAVSDA